MQGQLSKQVFLGQFLWLVDNEAAFAYGDEDNPRFFMVKKDAWEDFGKPATITVTIQPGGLLNGE